MTSLLMAGTPRLVRTGPQSCRASIPGGRH